MPHAIDERCEDECRCSCGKLMARLTVHGVEVQCRRCKLLHIIPFLMEEQTAASMVKPDCSSSGSSK